MPSYLMLTTILVRGADYMAGFRVFITQTYIFERYFRLPIAGYIWFIYLFARFLL